MQHESYSGGYNPELLAGLARREAVREAAFFVPYLQSGMHVLDCGCGPGGISLGLAALVPAGSVSGIDVEAGQLELGRAEARRRGLDNVRFEPGSVYKLPFPDGAFDAVLAHAVLYHLGRPADALKELKRVLRPGGIVGLRDADKDGDVYHPANPLLERFWNMAEQVTNAGGGDLRLGRRHRQLLREEGFTEIEATASYDCFGNTESTTGFAHFWADIFLPQHREQILAQAWASATELDAMAEALRAWGRHPDAFYARCRCEAVARNPAPGG